jgi:malate dehydrogenase
MRGVVFGEHGDSMVATPRYFTIGGVPVDTFIATVGVDPARIKRVIEEAKKGGTHFVNETGQSASAGPARSACDMLRCIITGEREVQPVVAVLEHEYDLLRKEDGLDSLCFGVPAMIGPYGVEKIYELPVDDIRAGLEKSAEIIKEDIRTAAGILDEKFGIR